MMELNIELMAEKFGQSPYETDYDLEKFRRGRAEYRGTDKDLANLTFDEFLTEIREELTDPCNLIAIAPLFFHLTQDQSSLLTQIYINEQAAKRGWRMLRNAPTAEARISKLEEDVQPASAAAGVNADDVPRDDKLGKITGWRCVICDIPLLEGESQICVYCYRLNRPIDLSDKGEAMLGEALEDVADGRVGDWENQFWEPGDKEKFGVRGRIRGGMETIDNDKEVV